MKSIDELISYGSLYLLGLITRTVSKVTSVQKYNSQTGGGFCLRARPDSTRGADARLSPVTHSFLTARLVSQDAIRQLIKSF